MIEKIIPSTWLDKAGRRLDCGPYLSGAVEAKVIIDSLSVQKDPLYTVTAGHDGGIYNGPQFGRTYVIDPRHGVPFLGSSSMLLADLSQVDLLKRKDAESPRLSFLKLKRDMTLISCSGTIGRMVYVRSDMDGMWSSQHILKVVPDISKILPGYLFAFLASRYGVSLVTGGTYGAIIQHIEPEHLRQIPVPRFDRCVEQHCHELVLKAAELRARATVLVQDAIRDTLGVWRIPVHSTYKNAVSPDVVIQHSSQLNSRFDAFFHATPAKNADLQIQEISKRITVRKLGECAAEVFETPRFGRIPVTDPRFGTPFMSIADIARIDPVSDGLISKRQVEQMRAAVKSGWLILPRVGQLEGLFGHVVCIPPHLDGVGVSDNNIRIVPRSREDSGYLFAGLCTPLCYWQIVRRACGTSIPYLDAARVAEVPMPWPERDHRLPIAQKVNTAMDLRSEAVQCERDAVATVEKAIDAGGK